MAVSNDTHSQKGTRIAPVLFQPHWPPVYFKSQYKIPFRAFKVPDLSCLIQKVYANETGTIWRY